LFALSLRQVDSKKFSRKNPDVQPFESGGETHLEFFCNKSNCSLFAFGSHSKKRPHNLVLGRMYDFHLFDCLELGIEHLQAIKDFKGAGSAQTGNKVGGGVRGGWGVQWVSVLCTSTTRWFLMTTPTGRLLREALLWVHLSAQLSVLLLGIPCRAAEAALVPRLVVHYHKALPTSINPNMSMRHVLAPVSPLVLLLLPTPFPLLSALLLQPCMVFVGEKFESEPQFKLAKSMLMDFFRGQQVRGVCV
jgi:hypothetical protein